MNSALHRQVAIGALGVVEIFAWGSSYYLPAVLAVPIAEDTGWPLPWIVGGLSLGLLVAGLIAPRVGRAIADRGGRIVMTAALILFALGLCILAAAPNPMVFMAGWLLMGAGMGCGLYDAAFATLTGIYGAQARPSIAALTLWGGFASTVCWPLSVFFLDHLGWRGACLAYAGIQVLISLPLLLKLVPRPVTGTKAVADNIIAAHASSRERRLLLMLGAIVTLSGFITSIISVHLLTLLQARGLALVGAVALGTLIGPSQVGARILEMLGGGRHHPRWTLMASLILTAAGIVLLWAGLPWLTLPIILYGGGNGIFSIARGTLPLAIFGPARYASLMGKLARPALFAQAIAPSVGAVIIERLGASSCWSMLAVLAMLNLALMAALWRAERTSAGPAIV